MSQQPILISIEGNIGSGKSTLLRELRSRNGAEWHFIDEPVESWMGLKNGEGESLLSLFYGDKRRWAYTFQNTALLTRIQGIRNTIQTAQKKRQGRSIFITERCVATDAHVFARLMHEDGEMDNLEMCLYNQWYEAFASQVPAPAAFVHVDTPVTVCDERINRRARDGEVSAIPIEYLDKLDSAHFRWLHATDFKAPVLRVDNVSKDPTPIEIVEEFIRAQADAPTPPLKHVLLL